jgi:hypothetical protein
VDLSLSEVLPLVSISACTLLAQVFKAKDQTKFFWIEHWKALLETCQVFGAHGISQNDARLIFAWSQTLVKDELKKRQRAVSLLWFDFLEVGRPPWLRAGNISLRGD